MSDLFKTLSGGFARFVFAWMTPSLISLGIFSIYVLPAISDTWLLRPVTGPASASGVAGAVIFAFFVLTLSVSFAYAALPIYQVLEGYHLPTRLKRRLRNRHLRRFAHIRQAEARFRQSGVLPPGYTTDDLWMRYPSDRSQVRATRLGNALTTMESWSLTRYHLDSQTMWHELQATASSSVRNDVDEGRAPVDFFVSSIVHMSLLSVSGIIVGAFTPDRQALVIGIGAALTVPLSYRLAVNNVIDWAQSVKAMVNVGRPVLADALGLTLPDRLQDEREMWSAHLHAIELANDHHLEAYNAFRRPSSE
jgi:hypothetical protein